MPRTTSQTSQPAWVQNGLPAPTGFCWDGCGVKLDNPNTYWLPGHDRKAEARLIEVLYGSTVSAIRDNGYGPDKPLPKTRKERLAERKPGRKQLALLVGLNTGGVKPNGVVQTYHYTQLVERGWAKESKRGLVTITAEGRKIVRQSMD